MFIREINEYGGGITKPADLHMGLTEKTKKNLELCIISDLESARQYAISVHNMKQNSAIPKSAIDMQLSSVRKACNLFAQHTICLQNPPPELKALHDTFIGNTSLMHFSGVTGPEVDALENKTYDKVLQEVEENFQSSAMQKPTPHSPMPVRWIR